MIQKRKVHNMTATTHSKPTQNARILDYLEKHNSITQLDALQLGVMRLASRISDLKRKGFDITSTTETVINRYGEKCRIKRYSLDKGAV